MKATSHHSTLCLNPSNHSSVPPEGLVLEAGQATPVPPDLGEYLRNLGCEVVDDPPSSRRLTPKEPE